MIVVFGSINVDLTFRADRLPRPGETLMAQASFIGGGGKGANQAVAAARDGATVAMIGAVGQDGMAETALAGLRTAGVDVTRVARVSAATGLASIVVDQAGENVIVVGSGANASARASWIEPEFLCPGVWVVLQNEVPADEAALVIAAARAAGARTILNLAPVGKFSDVALRSVDLLVVNAAEADALLPGARAASLRAALGVDVIVTRGADGVQMAFQSETRSFAAYSVQVIDTTAAGDCFVGVLAASLDRGASLEQAATRAVVAAGLACARVGSQRSLPDQAEIDAAMTR